MKKHNEGYALPFVLVVMIVMCLVTTGLLDGSLRNLKSQKAMISRMQDQYAAQGAIEQVIGQLGQQNAVAEPTAEGIRTMIASLCEGAFEDDSSGALTITSSVSGEIKINGNDEENPADSTEYTVEYPFTLTSTVDKTKITCSMKFIGSIEVNAPVLGDTTYTLTKSELIYTSYDQSTAETTGGTT